MNTPATIRNNGVYRINHEDGRPEFLVALENDDEGDYSFALARAVAIPGAGFAYDDAELLIFVGKESAPSLFTSYHDGEGRYDGRPTSDLIDTGLVAVRAGAAQITAPQECGRINDGFGI